MLFSVVVYSFVLFSLLGLAFLSSKRERIMLRKKRRAWVLAGNSDWRYQRDFIIKHSNTPFLTPEIFAAIFLFTVVFGLRYNVGIDFENYLYYYENPQDGKADEFLFSGITSLFRYLHCPSWVAFSLWACLQFTFLLYAFKDERRLHPFLMLSFICGQYFLLWMNVIRQDLATCIFIFSITFIEKRKFLSYLFWVFIAFGFHKTAIALLVFYPVFQLRKDYTGHPFIQEILLFGAAFVYIRNINLFEGLDSLLSAVLMGTNFEGYAYGAIGNTTTESVVGVSFLSSFLIDVAIIAFSDKLKKYYRSDNLLIFYNLYFLGALLGLICGHSFILLRPVRYLRFFKLVVSPYLLYYLYVKSKNKLNLLSLAAVLLMYVLQYVAIFLYDAESMYQYHSILF